MTFNVGDRVIGTDSGWDMNDAIIGNVGIIVYVGERSYLVDWDEPHDSFHSGGGRADAGWWIDQDDPCLALYIEDEGTGTAVEKRCRKLWKNSKWVQKHPEFAY